MEAILSLILGELANLWKLKQAYDQLQSGQELTTEQRQAVALANEAARRRVAVASGHDPEIL